jgi:hypothetical protein
VSGTDTLLARLRTRFNALVSRVDPDSPGNSKYYGTNSGGTKGFYDLPSGSGTPATTVVAETSYSQASAVGSSTNYARQDHTHGTPALPSASDLSLSHAVLGVARFDMVPGAVGQNYCPIGYLAQGSFSRASTTLVTRGRRLLATHAPSAATDGQQLGGYNTTANNLIHFASSGQTWTAYLFFGTKAGTSLRGAFALCNANPADSNGVANNSIGVRYRPGAGDTDWTAFCTSSGGATTTGSTGVPVAASTLYVVEVKWDGTSAYVRMATVNETTGAFGSWSTAVTLSSNLPSTSAGMTPATNWWVVGSPATHPNIDIGGHTVLPWAV